MELFKNTLLTVVGTVVGWAIFIVFAYFLIAVTLSLFLTKLWIYEHLDIVCFIIVVSSVPLVILISWLHKRYSQR